MWHNEWQQSGSGIMSGNRVEMAKCVAAEWRWHNEWQQSGDGITSGSRVEEMS